MQSEITALQNLRKSKVIVYATGDRPSLSLQIEEDIIEPIHQILESIGTHQQIDLVIYSRGGATIVPLPLVRLIRKYCTKFGAIVPFRAHSAATMICIGADEIYMTKKAELGPVDPQLNVNTPQGQRSYASTDIFAYLEFAKNEVGWQPTASTPVELLEFFHKYCALSPDYVGKIYRMFTQSRKYIHELADSHAKGYRLKKVADLAETLVRGFGSHDYKIDSHEARSKLGLNVLKYDAATETAVDSLYRKMAGFLKLTTPFAPVPGAGGAPCLISEPVGLILSENKQLVKNFQYTAIATPQGTKLDARFTEWV